MKPCPKCGLDLAEYGPAFHAAMCATQAKVRALCEKAIREKDAPITARDLMALKPGAQLAVRLKSGREVTLRLTRRAYLTSAGKPGLSRVQLECLDEAKAARKSDEASIFSRLDCRTTVSGAQVLRVVRWA